MAGSSPSVYQVVNKTKGSLLGNRVTLADTSLSRLVGLLGKRSLPPGGGLWILPSQGVHTMGMMFAIDVAFLDENLRVLAVRHKMAPFRLTSINWKTRSVLELPSGTLALARTIVDDELMFEKTASDF